MQEANNILLWPLCNLFLVVDKDRNLSFWKFHCKLRAISYSCGDEQGPEFYIFGRKSHIFTFFLCTLKTFFYALCVEFLLWHNFPNSGISGGFEVLREHVEVQAALVEIRRNSLQLVSSFKCIEACNFYVNILSMRRISTPDLEQIYLVQSRRISSFA